MTTNVYDREAKLLASDSRWSAESKCKQYLLFTDTARFDKIFVADGLGLAFAFTGDASIVEKFKICLSDDNNPEAEYPKCPTEAVFTYFAVDLVTGTIAHQHFPERFQPKIITSGSKSDLANIEALFAGSGAQSAYFFWMDEPDPVSAVRFAAEYDALTGGDVITTCLNTGTHNATTGTTALLLDALMEGSVMQKVNTTYTNPTPLAESLHIPEVAALVQGLQSGSVTASAPFPGMGEAVYTEEQIRAHDEFMLSLRKKKMQKHQ